MKEFNSLNSFFSSIDWFKFELVFPYDNSDCLSYYVKLFEILKLDSDIYDHREIFRNYSDVRVYDGNTIYYSKPKENCARQDGRDYIIIDMSGQACRDFENRGGNWWELIKFIKDFNMFVYMPKSNEVVSKEFYDSLPYECDSDNLIFISIMKRIDINFDIVNNPFFTFEQLKSKIRSCSYVSRFRAFKTIGDKVSNLAHKSHQEIFNGTFFAEEDSAFNDLTSKEYSLIDSRSGYSVKWGNKGNLEINIYDKKAEVFVKKKEILPYDEVIRYEMRFYNNHAQTVVYNLPELIENALTDKYVVELFYSLITFKAKSYYDCSEEEKHNYNRDVNDWAPMTKLLKAICNFEKKKYKLLLAQEIPLEDTYKKSKTWVTDSVFGAITKFHLLDKSSKEFDDVSAYCLLKSFQKGYINDELLHELNGERKRKGFYEYDILDLFSLAKTKYVEKGGDPLEFKMPYKMYKENYSHYLKFNPDFFECPNKEELKEY